ncbi:cobalamin (vitamin B12) biosynthesis CbiX protein [Thalassoporum mexicanum PCC 7367]|nr:cobalamin (vitamin B12) biosynthesis CbiX protein [Pseudanabaena sp. PCC 7367]
MGSWLKLGLFKLLKQPESSGKIDRAIFFVIHGSSNHRSLRSLRKIITAAKVSSDALIDGGCLEGLDRSLSEQLIDFGYDALYLGYSQIEVVPVFLLPGVHVKEDLPIEVEAAQSLFDDRKLQFHLTEYLGTHAQIPALLAQRFNNWENSHSWTQSPNVSNISNVSNIKCARVIIAHGSKRSGANQPIEELARSLSATTAYWSVAPDLETKINQLLDQGFMAIEVLPYFLSAGGITKAIGAQIEQLASDRQVQIELLPLPFTAETITELAMADLSDADLEPNNSTIAIPRHLVTGPKALAYSN